MDSTCLLCWTLKTVGSDVRRFFVKLVMVHWGRLWTWSRSIEDGYGQHEVTDIFVNAYFVVHDQEGRINWNNEIKLKILIRYELRFDISKQLIKNSWQILNNFMIIFVCVHISVCHTICSSSKRSFCTKKHHYCCIGFTSYSEKSTPNGVTSNDLRSKTSNHSPNSNPYPNPNSCFVRKIVS